MTEPHTTSKSSQTARFNLPDYFEGTVEIVLRDQVFQITVEHTIDEAVDDTKSQDQQLLEAKADKPPVCSKVPRYNSKGRQIGFIIVCSQLSFKPII